MKEKETPTGQSKPKQDVKQRVLTIIGIVLCALLLPILILNCTLIVKSWINEDEVPSIGGRTPLIVLTDSMEPKIHGGDIIICQKIEGKDVKLEDVISFFDPAGNGTSVVTHRVIDIKEENGKLLFQTKGDNNNSPDRLWVSEDALVGIWSEGARIPLVGYVALFMQTTWGLIICVLLPVGLFVGYDLLRRKKAEKGREDDVEALKRELEALKAANAANAEKTDGDEN